MTTTIAISDIFSLADESISPDRVLMSETATLGENLYIKITSGGKWTYPYTPKFTAHRGYYLGPHTGHGEVAVPSTHQNAGETP